MLIERDELAQRGGRQALEQKRIRRPIAGEHAMRHEPVRRALRAYLVSSFAESERGGLREDVGHQEVVMATDGIQRLGEGDKVGRNQARALMKQLVERMLSVGARFTPIDRPGRVFDFEAVDRYMFAVTLHRQLLE